MTRVPLSRLPGERVLVVDGGAEQVLAMADLPAYVAERARPTRPRWVWDDTARWYPPLLAAGVRVERCHDLRLGHRLLRRAPAVDARLLDGRAVGALGPARTGRAVRPGAVPRRRHGRAPARRPRGRPAAGRGRGLGRGRPARPAARGGVGGRAGRRRDDVRRRAVAGRRARAPAHRPARAAAAARRPAAAARGAGRPRCARALDAPGLNPDSRPELLAALRRAGLEVRRHPRVHPARGSTTRASRRCCATSSSRTCSTTNGWAWIDQWVSGGRFRPVVPAGRLRPPAGGRPTAAARCRSRCRSARRPSPTTAGCSSSPTSPSSSRACSPA